MIEKGKQLAEEKINQVIEDLGLELVELNFKINARTVMVDVLADRVNGGITIKECSIINKRILKVFEEENIFDDNFVVEVASPGIDRPLQTLKDFVRVKGKKVLFSLKVCIAGKKELSGELVGVEKSNIIIKTKDKEIIIPQDDILKAVQIV